MAGRAVRRRARVNGTYRRKPRNIEAVFYNGSNVTEVLDWLRAQCAATWFLTSAPNYPDVTVIVANDGEEDWYLWPGQWMTRDADGDFDIYRNGPFTAEYEPLPEGPPAAQRSVRWQDVRHEFEFTEDEEAEIAEVRRRQMAACEELTAAYEAEHGLISDEAYAEADAVLNTLPADEATKAYVDQHERYAPRHAAP